MGCDIHLHLERKVNDRWEHWKEIDICMSYELFGYMVNGHPRAFKNQIGLFDARDIPLDINPLTKELLYRDADHTFSWLTYQEALKLKDLLDFDVEFLDADVIDYLYEEDNEEDKKIELRFVFGFDN